MWRGALKSIIDLIGPNSPGAQPYDATLPSPFSTGENIGDILTSNGDGTYTWLPPVKGVFSAKTSTLDAFQIFPPSANVSDLNAGQIYGIVLDRAGTISSFTVRWTGNGLNTIQIADWFLALDGTGVPDTDIAGQPTTAGQWSATITFSPVTVARGQVLMFALLCDAPLAGALTWVSATVA